jgi:hypothetical protein
LSIAPVVAIKSTGSFGFVSGFVPVTPIAISDFYGGKAVTSGRCYYFVIFSYFKKNTFFIPFINTLSQE